MPFDLTCVFTKKIMNFVTNKLNSQNFGVTPVKMIHFTRIFK